MPTQNEIKDLSEAKGTVIAMGAMRDLLREHLRRDPYTHARVREHLSKILNSLSEIEHAIDFSLFKTTDNP